MKRVLPVLLICMVAVQAYGQWDTVGRTRLRQNVVPVATSTALIAGGSLLAFEPTVHGVAEALRHEVLLHHYPRLKFDNYIQYLPAATPLALNLAGLKGRHSLRRLALLEGGSYLLGTGWLCAAKYGFAVKRPDESSYNSFPSGHTFTAFTGAEVLRREYGEEYPWVAVVGYAVATLVGAMRIYNNRHWAGDVLAGAGLGILSVSLVYWVLD